jgi:hypothetical protein
MKQWFSDMQKEVHVLGPLLPAGFGTGLQNSEEGANVDMETLLGEMLVQFSFLGVQLYIFSSGFLWHSALAVSFGIR